MITLNYGYLLPENGDIGNEIFDALESNIQRLNDHTHNGINSSKLPSSSIAKVVQNIVQAGWVLQGNGIYRQLVNIVGGSNYDDFFIFFRDTATKENCLLTHEKVSATSFYVYTNDSSQDITIYYV